MARYASAPGSLSASVDVAADMGAIATQSVVTVLADETAATLTAAQTANGLVIVTGTADAQITLPTAALLIAAMANAQVDLSYVDLVVRNETNQTIDVLADTGVTLDGLGTIATNKVATFRLAMASATTVTAYRVSTADI